MNHTLYTISDEPKVGLTELFDVAFLVIGILEQLLLQRRPFPILEILHDTLRIGILPGRLIQSVSPAI